LTIPDLRICRGEKVALVGFSGCGKSTLLDLMAMVLRPDKAVEFSFRSGPEQRLNVIEAWERKDLDVLADTRMHHMGYVLQTGGLLPFLSVRDNIGISREGLGLPVKEAVEAVAGRLGIERHLDKFPAQLSVGERQRVAIARAMAHEPSVVIADEPTASLDPINAEEIMGLFSNLADEFQVTLVVGTHDWDRVEERGFRRVKFELEKDAADGTVRATVSG
jgi:putative ABC transport system ATP-binding protein